MSYKQELISSSTRRLGNRLYQISFNRIPNSEFCANLAQTYPGEQAVGSLLHDRLNHCHHAILHRIYPQHPKSNSPCLACIAGKIHRFPFKRTTPLKDYRPGEMASSDLTGPFLPARGGIRYCNTIIDHGSNFVTVYGLSHKSHTDSTLEEYEQFVNRQCKNAAGEPVQLRIMRSDFGGEYTSIVRADRDARTGQLQQFSAPYTPQQNGKVERVHRTIDEAVRTYMQAAHAPGSFWMEATNFVVFVHNRLPHLQRGGEWLSRMNLFFGNKDQFNYADLRVWGSEVWAWTPERLRNGLKSHVQARVRRAIFLGFEPNTHAYRLYCLQSHKTFVAPPSFCVCNESVFPWRDRANWNVAQRAQPTHYVLPGITNNVDYQDVHVVNEVNSDFDASDVDMDTPEPIPNSTQVPSTSAIQQLPGQVRPSPNGQHQPVLRNDDEVISDGEVEQTATVHEVEVEDTEMVEENKRDEFAPQTPSCQTKTTICHTRTKS